MKNKYKYISSTSLVNIFATKQIVHCYLRFAVFFEEKIIERLD